MKIWCMIYTSLSYIVLHFVPTVDTLSCPYLWHAFRRMYSNFDTCIFRLPDMVTWDEGEEQCQDFVGQPLAWNETLYDAKSEGSVFKMNETEIWSSLRIIDGKLIHSGAPMTTVGLFPFARPGGSPVITWMSDQPKALTGDCVSTTIEQVAKLSQCDQKKYMYCQRHLVLPTVQEAPTFCSDGFIGSIHWQYCYKLIYENVTFTQAKKKCGKLGARLLTMRGDLITGNRSQTSRSAEFDIFKDIKKYYNVSTKVSQSPLKFWYIDHTTGDTNCTAMTFYSHYISTEKANDCETKLFYMCQEIVKVKTDRQMDITIDIVELLITSEIPKPYTRCNLSRSLLPGENIYVFINDKPMNNVFRDTANGLQYLLGHSRIYPRIDRHGYHRCEVRGLRNKQKWSADLFYQEPGTILFKGSVDLTPALPSIKYWKYNLATAPETSLPQGASLPTYYLPQALLRMVSRLGRNENRLKGSFASRVNAFRNFGKTAEFDILLHLTEANSATGEQSTILFLRNFLIQQITNSSTSNRKRRSVDGKYSFIPSSLVINSTLTCSGYYYFEESDIEVNFLTVPYGSTTNSSEMCITDKKPLATADCVGGIGRATQLVNAVVNPRCIFKDLATSNVTEILKHLTTVDIDSGNIRGVVDTVKNITSRPDILTSIDVISIATVLVHISNVTSVSITEPKDILGIVDNVMNVDLQTLKEAQNDGSATNRILEVLDSVSRNVDIQTGKSVTFRGENMLVDIFELSSMSSATIGIQIEDDNDQTLTDSTVQTLMSDTNVTITTINAAIILPVDLINNLTSMNNSTRLALNIYRNWKLFSVRSDLKEYLPNSRVVAASLSMGGVPITSLGEYSVQTLFFPRTENENSKCGYWNHDLHSTSGGWATNGCSLNRTEYGRHVCVCDHLTNFAVIVNIQGQDTLVDSLAINIISWIGLILSIVGLSLTVLSFLLFKHLRKGRGQQTLINLAVSLLCFLIVFIVGIGQTHDFYGCIVVAALLHYFILVAFMWMLMEGILQYLRFVKVLGTYIPHFFLKTAVPAWGLPLIPVIIVLAVDHEMYHGGQKACWMSLAAFYYAFIIPVGIIILSNIVIFIMILKNLLCRPKGLQSNQSDRKRAMMNLRAAFSVFVLLGLTWIFGFFTIKEASRVFQYIFTILNVFQGFLIFVLFTAREKRVRQSWRKLCCKDKTKDKYVKSDSSSNQSKTQTNSSYIENTSDDTKPTRL